MVNKAESKLTVKEALKMAWYGGTQIELHSVIEKGTESEYYHVHGKNEVVKGKAGELLREGTPYDYYPVLAFNGTVDGALVITYCEN